MVVLVGSLLVFRGRLGPEHQYVALAVALRLETLFLSPAHAIASVELAIVARRERGEHRARSVERSTGGSREQLDQVATRLRDVAFLSEPLLPRVLQHDVRRGRHRFAGLRVLHV